MAASSTSNVCSKFINEFNSVKKVADEIASACDNSHWGQAWRKMRESSKCDSLIRNSRDIKRDSDEMYKNEANEFGSSTSSNSDIPWQDGISVHGMESTIMPIIPWQTDIPVHGMGSTGLLPSDNTTIDQHELESTGQFPSDDTNISQHELEPTGPHPDYDSTINQHELESTGQLPSDDTNIIEHELESTGTIPSDDTNIGEHELESTGPLPPWDPDIPDHPLDSTVVPDPDYPPLPPPPGPEGGGDDINEHELESTGPLPPWDPNIPEHPSDPTVIPDPDVPTPPAPDIPPWDPNIPIHSLPPTSELPPWNPVIPQDSLPHTSELPPWNPVIPQDSLISTEIPSWNPNIPVHVHSSTVFPPISEFPTSNTYFESSLPSITYIDDLTVPAKTRIKKSIPKLYGWRGWDPEWTKGLVFLLHDGDQQLFNPYGHPEAKWTIFSFRPCDRNLEWPQIAITPSSFQVIDSIDHMLNSIPYVVVKEYFFRNQATNIINLVKGIIENAHKWMGTDKKKEKAKADEGWAEKLAKVKTAV